jgi:hypothetical protein
MMKATVELCNHATLAGRFALSMVAKLHADISGLYKTAPS